MAPTQDEPSSQELLQAQVDLWHHALGFVKSMALKCAMELQIPNTIQGHGGSMTPLELATKIGLHPCKLPRLRRLMRVLTVLGIFVIHEAASEDKEVVYGLTPTTRLLVSDEVKSNLFPILSLMLDSTIIFPFLGMHSWFLDECSTSLFKKAHGITFWEMAGQHETYNQLINNAMVSDSNFLMDIILRECGDVFLGINSLIDVAGGHGGAARAIAKAFPHMKCTVSDLPHVVAEAPTDGNVSFISGDMFKYIPPANALFLKWIFHDWGDEDSVKILKKCKEAIPPRDAGGKVIIVDMVVGSGPNEIVTRETQVLYDLFIMCIEGIEREESKWKKIFMEAGFSDYKIMSVLGVRSVIELYP
ncbi:acetylserotonin O-methyltransferase 1 isoform X1 [Lolium perenne]|uniref:acetylserotonin O-methyltransferase 1 isoform X1 n=1 Tax=Lolium perenne TaxID=4522 RepID=UPI0021F6381F|nr:acetylserotonin O-methyltransferase 1-like isoform X1 [Lolium perenne]